MKSMFSVTGLAMASVMCVLSACSTQEEKSPNPARLRPPAETTRSGKSRIQGTGGKGRKGEGDQTRG